MTRKILQSVTLPSVLASLAEIEDSGFAILRDEIRGPLAFENDLERAAPLAKRVGLDAETTQYLLGALAFFYEEIHAEEVDPSALPSLVGEIFDRIAGPVSSGQDADLQARNITQTRLSILMERSDNPDEFKKIQRLRAGFLPNATGFGTFIDLRPNISADGATVVGLLPLVQFRISTDASDPAQKAFLFQLDSAGLRKLKQAVERAEEKIKTISSHASISSIIVSR